MFADAGRHTSQKHFASRRFRHRKNVFADQLHGIAAVTLEHAMPIIRLGSAAVDHGYEVISYDDSVLAFLLWVLRDVALFDNLHVVVCLYTRRNIGAGPVSPADSWRW